MAHPVPGPLRARACAKINLSLRVLGRRADGYHELDTLFQSVDLADELEAAPSGELSLVVEGAAPAGPENLVLRAARALARRAGIPPRAALRLKKSIPMGAGLGGGSSDAAAALRLLDRLWSLATPEPQLHALARELGADVPYFLVGGTARGRARGDELEPVPELPPRFVVIALPALALSTAWVFGEYAKVARSPGEPPPREAPDWARDGFRGLVNDLEEPVFAAHPRLAQIRDRIESLGAEHARMTGSGSALYGLFPAREEAESASAALGGERGIEAVVCRTVGRERFRGAGDPDRRGRLDAGTRPC